MHKLFTVCTEPVRSPYTEHAASGLPNPTHLEGEVRFDQAQDQQVVTTRSPRIVTESSFSSLTVFFSDFEDGLFVYAYGSSVCDQVNVFAHAQ